MADCTNVFLIVVLMFNCNLNVTIQMENVTVETKTKLNKLKNVLMQSDKSNLEINNFVYFSNFIYLTQK